MTEYILDAYALIYRCYFAFGTMPLTDSQGRNVSALFGVFNTLHSFFHKYRPGSFVAAFDSRTPTFRHELYDQYKANRAAAPDDLHAQVPWIEEALTALGAQCIRCDGFEADDIIATIASECEKTHTPCRILTGDKDLCALVTANTHLVRPAKGKGHGNEWEEIDEDAVRTEWGVSPAQITDLLALMGDTSDNIPGVPGVGPKTAAKYLAQYGSLEALLQRADDVKGKAGEKLRAGAQSARLSRQLVQLRYDVPLGGHLDTKRLHTTGESLDDPDKDSTATPVVECFSPQAKNVSKPPMVWDYEACASVLEKYEQKTLAAKWRKLGALSTASSPSPSSLSPSTSEPPAFDTLPPGAVEVAAWMLDSNRGKYIIDKLAASEGLTGETNTLPAQLYQLYAPRLSERGLVDLFTTLEVPLMDVLRRMEKTGIHLDGEALEKYNKELSLKIAALESEIYTLCGHEFNIGSPKQLAAVLYDEMGLIPAKRSTDAATLEELLPVDPAVGKVLEWRELTKLRSTYLEPLPRMVDANGRVHTTFVQTGTATGRLSSRDPNLQNIPVRTEEGRRIRSAFTAPPGRVLVSADYSQIELVVLAALSGDKNMIKSFADGVDIHRTTAKSIFGTDDITSDMRRTAKTINFGVIYGMSAFRLARDLGISRSQAADFIKRYFAAYPAIEAFKARAIQMAQETGYVTTLMGRQRAVVGLDGNRMAREAAERVAVNTRVQGSAADIMKKAMLDVDEAIREESDGSPSLVPSRWLSAAEGGVSKPPTPAAQLLLQVHDELILECDEADADSVAAMVKSKMENAVALTSPDGTAVPLKVSVECGTNWGEFH